MTTIVERINDFIGNCEIIAESGMRNIKDIAKEYKEAIAYFHTDLDGVCSCIGMKNYLENYGIRTIDVMPIQYGNKEFNIPAQPKKRGLMYYMVDFAHGKANLRIWLDHHDVEHVVDKSGKVSTSFSKTKSNAEYISTTISARDIFPPDDIKLISMVDSADFYANEVSPEQLYKTIFTLQKDKPLKINKLTMGLVVNKLVLVYKNKPDFLKTVIMRSSPSLYSMFNVIVDYVKKSEYVKPGDYEKFMDAYIEKRHESRKVNSTSPDDAKDLKDGESMMINGVIAQYGGGNMFKAYDRYVPFKIWEDADFLVIAWPMGLIQASKNPFKKVDKDIHLGEICSRVLQKYKSRLKKDMVSLGSIKRRMEVSEKEMIINGFTFEDFAMLGGDIKSDRFREIVRDISKKNYSRLSNSQKEILEKAKVSAWDIVTSQSGGHKSISNIPLSLLPNMKDYIKDIFCDVFKELIKENKKER